MNKSTSYPPSVTGVLHFTDHSQWTVAAHAANSFLAQAYPNKHLVIVNTAPPTSKPERPLTPDEVQALKAGKSLAELGVPCRQARPLLCGASRRLNGTPELLLEPGTSPDKGVEQALQLFASDFVAVVAPYDIWHRYRLSHLACHADAKHTVVLTSQLLLEIETGRTARFSPPYGVAQSGLTPSSAVVDRTALPLMKAAMQNADDAVLSTRIIGRGGWSAPLDSFTRWRDADLRPASAAESCYLAGLLQQIVPTGHASLS